MSDIQKEIQRERGLRVQCVMNYNNIILKTEIIRLKLINNHVAEFLRYNLYGTLQ